MKIIPLLLALLLVTSIALVALVSPPTPLNNISLAWDANPEPNITHYRVYWGTASGTYEESADSTTTTHTVANLDHNKDYFFVVTAFNAEGLESLPSNEVFSRPPPPNDARAPSSPTGVQTISVEVDVKIRLDPNSSTPPKE